MSKILKIRARQVFDSRGTPTIEAEVYSKNLIESQDEIAEMKRKFKIMYVYYYYFIIFHNKLCTS